MAVNSDEKPRDLQAVPAVDVIASPIYPVDPVHYLTGSSNELDLKAICVFAAIGFFLDDDTYFKDVKVLRPGRSYAKNESGKVAETEQYFRWHYSPRNISFNQAVEEYAHLFEKITRESVGNRSVLLSLSGGLDSRTLAAALADRPEQISGYSYQFPHGVPENKYGAAIADACNFKFRGYTIPTGYLWEKIELIGKLNFCYADFSLPRQMAVMDDLLSHGDIFVLGHVGDVLFDDSGVDASLPFELQIDVVLKKILKKGGVGLADVLWRTWGLEGSFYDYLHARVSQLLSGIDIDNANARLRAFKSLYWVPRWTSSNLLLFKHHKPLLLPYYEDRMAEFICTVPEEHLAGRRIQIEYLKTKMPSLARIPWQKYDPCNLYNYKEYFSNTYLPIRIIRKFRRMFEERVLQRHPVFSNWQIQLQGKENNAGLSRWLFENPLLSDWVSPQTVDTFYKKFLQDGKMYQHTVSVLLVL